MTLKGADDMENEKKPRQRMNVTARPEGQTVAQWQKENTEQIPIRPRREWRMKERIAAAAATHDTSATQYIITAIEKQLDLDGYPRATDDQRDKQQQHQDRQPRDKTP